MGVSENSGTVKSSIFIGFSLINHPFWGTPIFGTPHTAVQQLVEFRPLKAGSMWMSPRKVPRKL